MPRPSEVYRSLRIRPAECYGPTRITRGAGPPTEVRVGTWFRSDALIGLMAEIGVVFCT